MKGQKGYAIVSVWPRQAVSLGALARALWRRLKRWHELARQRRQLAALSDAALKDLGLSRADALQEVDRPVWDDPLAQSRGK